jgi:hypothetical protein
MDKQGGDQAYKRSVGGESPLDEDSRRASSMAIFHAPGMGVVMINRHRESWCNAILNIIPLGENVAAEERYA